MLCLVYIVNTLLCMWEINFKALNFCARGLGFETILIYCRLLHVPLPAFNSEIFSVSRKSGPAVGSVYQPSLSNHGQLSSHHRCLHHSNGFLHHYRDEQSEQLIRTYQEALGITLVDLNQWFSVCSLWATCSPYRAIMWLSKKLYYCLLLQFSDPQLVCYKTLVCHFMVSGMLQIFITNCI